MRLVHRRRRQAGRKNGEWAATVVLLRLDAGLGRAVMDVVVVGSWCPEEGSGSTLGCEKPGGEIQGIVKADSELVA